LHVVIKRIVAYYKISSNVCVYLADAIIDSFYKCNKIMKLVAPPNFAMCDSFYTLHIIGFKVSDITLGRELKMEGGCLSSIAKLGSKNKIL
jgi:hypothetical protein